MTDRDRERISRLEALLARVKARSDVPRPEEQAGHPSIENQNGESVYPEAELIEDEPTDDVAAPAQFPAESSTLQALPPPPPNSSNSAFAAPDSTPRSDPTAKNANGKSERAPISEPISKPDAPALPNMSPASLEEAFEQYEIESEVVELTPDADDDAVRPSVPAPVMSDEMFDEAEIPLAPPAEEYQSQQRLVVAPSTRPTSGVDDGELEVLGVADLDGDDDIMDVDTGDLLSRASEEDVPSGRPTRQAEEMIATILSSGLDAPPENANRPVLELQEDDEIEEPPPSSRRPVSHEEVHEQELTFENDPPPLMTPPPESGRQVALPDLSSTSLSSAFEAEFTGVGKADGGEPSVVRAPLADNSGVAIVVAPTASRGAVTFGELIDLALSI